MQAWAEKFYRSKAWRKCRDAFFIFKHGLCERCKGHGVIAHHKKKLTPLNINDPSVTLNWDNLQLLCIECHNIVHGGSVTADGLIFDAEGNLTQT